LLRMCSATSSAQWKSALPTSIPRTPSIRLSLPHERRRQVTCLTNTGSMRCRKALDSVRSAAIAAIGHLSSARARSPRAERGCHRRGYLGDSLRAAGLTGYKHISGLRPDGERRDPQAAQAKHEDPRLRTTRGRSRLNTPPAQSFSQAERRHDRGPLWGDRVGVRPTPRGSLPSPTPRRGRESTARRA
jgi:hypothetical protein